MEAPRVFVVREIAPGMAELIIGQGRRGDEDNVLMFPLTDNQLRLLELQAGDIRRARDARLRRAG